MRKHAVAFAVAIWLAWASRLPAQSPDAVARAVLRADSLGDWAALLRLAHPDALADYRAQRVFQLRMLGGVEWPGSDYLERDMDSLQRAHVAQATARHRQMLLNSVYQVPTADSLARLSPDSVFARTIRFEHHQPAGANAQGATSSASTTLYRIIGAVSASDTVAYVVIEQTSPKSPIVMPEPFDQLPEHETSAQVMTIRRFRRQWRSMLDAGVDAGYFLALDLRDEDSTTNSPMPHPR